MSISKIIKTILFGMVYGSNLLFALGLWWCGVTGNIMLGILLIACYRLSLWSAPFMVTAVCWLPLKPKVPARKRLIFNFAHLLFCGGLFILCRLLFGNWY